MLLCFSLQISMFEAIAQWLLAAPRELLLGVAIFELCFFGKLCFRARSQQQQQQQQQQQPEKENIWLKTSSLESLDYTTLCQTRDSWRTQYTTFCEFYPKLSKDPYFVDSTNEVTEASFISRFLRATVNEKHADPVEATLRRIKTVMTYRRDFDTNAFYTPDMAFKLFNPESNPGAEMYFCDGCAVDKNGMPFITGRLNLCDDDFLDAANHLRAAMFVLDRGGRASLMKTPTDGYILY